MAIGQPSFSDVYPAVNDTDVVLRPTIRLTISGAGLLDPLTWDDSTFALYGPGDVVLETGPGTILNSGLNDYPYPLLDGPLKRERIAGTFDVYTSGNDQSLGVVESNIGISGSIVYALFTPSSPLNKNTIYNVVVVGNDSQDWLPAGDKSFAGLTTYTSASGFANISSTSGFIGVKQPYNHTTENSLLFNPSTNYQETYTIAITSGTGYNNGLKFTWDSNRFESPNNGINTGNEIHTLDRGLKIQFNGLFISGEVFTLDVYKPVPLSLTNIWSFSTGELNLTSPPAVPDVISVIIDETAGGGFSVDTVAAGTISPLRVISSTPSYLDYGINSNLQEIVLEFNKTLDSNSITASDISISGTALLGIPGVTSTGGILISGITISGTFLTIVLTE